MKTAGTLLLLVVCLIASQSLAYALSGKGSTTVSYSPLNYTVPTAVTGSSSSVSITLFDTGSNPLTINTLIVSGLQAADYSLGGTCTNGAVIPQGGTCTIQVTFTPLAAGQRNAFINATFLNAPALNLPLTAHATAPGPVLTITSTGPVIFNSTPVGTPPPPVGPTFPSALEITMANAGSRTLTYSMNIIGDNPGDFVPGHAPVSPPCLSNTALASLAHCGIGINFLPTAEGLRKATIHIVTNDPTQPVIDIAMSGVGTPAPPPPPPTPIVSAEDFTDLWSSAAGEQDWNLSINHHKATTDALVAVWHTHDVDGSDMWLELKDGHWTDALTFTGNLHRLRGTAFSLPDDPTLFTDTVVGTATLTFTDFANGTLSYTVNGISGSKTITRTTF